MKAVEHCPGRQGPVIGWSGIVCLVRRRAWWPGAGFGPLTVVSRTSGPRSVVRVLADRSGPVAVMKSHRRGTAGAAGAAREESALARVAAASSAVGAPAVSPALLGQRVRTHQLLLAHIPGVRAIDVPPGERGAAVLAVAASLAQLHALTRTAPSDNAAVLSGTDPDLTGLAALCDAVGLVLPLSTTTQIRMLLAAPSALVALMHGDVCLDNVIIADGRAVLLDWETARIGDGMRDLAALVLAFPTCKCTPALDRVTRRELVTRYVESHRRWAPQPLAPEALRAGVARAALAWVVDPDALVPQAQRAHGGRLAATLDTDWIWGARTARQRLVLRLGLYAEAAASVPAHAGPRQLALKLQQALARHWDIKTTSSPAP